MAEEFHESDIIFSGRHRLFSCHRDYAQMILLRNSSWTLGKHKNANNDNKKDDLGGSLPVKIPESETDFRFSSSEVELESEDMVPLPPHVIVGRRVAGKMAFSVCTGNGRTLKGRDLSQVRNSILRMTGFLET